MKDTCYIISMIGGNSKRKVVSYKKDMKRGGHGSGHTFILGIYPATEGEYALSAAMLVSLGEDHRGSSGITMGAGLLRFFLVIGRKLDQFRSERVLLFSHFLTCSIKLYRSSSSPCG